MSKELERFIENLKHLTSEQLLSVSESIDLKYECLMDAYEESKDDVITVLVIHNELEKNHMEREAVNAEMARRANRLMSAIFNYKDGE